MSNPSTSTPPSGLPCPNSSASFWHSQPNPHLLSHRTTATLPPTADIVIIGSGITGASIARYLSASPRSSSLTTTTLMLEAREACWGATGRNGGHCQPLLTERPPNIGAFEIRNVEAVRSYIEDHGVDCDWRLGSACRAFFSQRLWDDGMEELRTLERVAPELRALVTVVTEKEELARLRVSPEAVGATVTRGAAQLWPYKYVTAVLQEEVEKGRLNLQTNTPVTKLEPVAAERGKEAGGVLVHTPRGTVRAKHVICATNGYTSHLLPSFASLIVPTRCEMSALQPPAGSERLPNSYGFVGKTVADDDYLIQLPFSTDALGRRRGGQLMFGGGSTHRQYPRLGISDDDIIDQGSATYLRQALLRYLQLGGDDAEAKQQGELIASHQWTGIKGFSRDNYPWVGKTDVKGVWLCGGYTGHGMPNATLCGRAVALMVLSQLPTEDQDSFDAEKALADVTSTLLAAGDLPEQYLLTAERVERALQMPSVAQRDEEEAMPLDADDFSESDAESFVKDHGFQPAVTVQDRMSSIKESCCAVM